MQQTAWTPAADEAGDQTRRSFEPRGLDGENTMAAKKIDTSARMFMACESGNGEMLEQALATKGVKVNAKEATFGMTALHIAASKGYKPLVEALLARGSDVEAREETGRTALHAASFRGQLEIVELLIEKGAKINATTNDAKTPLDWAILNNKTNVANFIREKGGKSGKDLASPPAPVAAGGA
jgi:ankyrin repeat protein